MSIFGRDNRGTIVIAGCGNIGSHLIPILCEQYKISVIDADGGSFAVLPETAINCYTQGDATDIDILEIAGIKTADVVVAATNNDNVNIMIAQIAKNRYKVNTVIVLVEDIAKESLCSENGIVLISPFLLSINQIQQTLTNEMK